MAHLANDRSSLGDRRFFGGAWRAAWRPGPASR